ncbi:hypothetical protein evm_000813 [Chilo suppressalis]|nr:hypothetical protein evm_000813 [Chilo suppressalis]
MVMASGGGGLVQSPPDMMHHHNIMDTSSHVEMMPKKLRLSLCVGCGGQIHDQYILRVAPDLEWHAACLKCQECRQFLDESCTCFVRDGKTYCKRDYTRLFGTKCDKCGASFSKNDFVMRAKTKIYHIDCFRCCACARQLIPDFGAQNPDRHGVLFSSLGGGTPVPASPFGSHPEPSGSNHRRPGPFRSA